MENKCYLPSTYTCTAWSIQNTFCLTASLKRSISNSRKTLCTGHSKWESSCKGGSQSVFPPHPLFPLHLIFFFKWYLQCYLTTWDSFNFVSLAWRDSSNYSTTVPIKPWPLKKPVRCGNQSYSESKPFYCWIGEWNTITQWPDVSKIDIKSKAEGC